MAKHKSTKGEKNKQKAGGGKRLKKGEMIQAILSVFQAAPKENRSTINKSAKS